MTVKCRGNPIRKALSRLATMRQPTAFALALALGVGAVFALVSCGGGDDAKLLPGNTANEITENLDTVKLLTDAGECAGAEEAAEQVSAQIETLEGVDQTLKRALQQGTTRLNEVVETCEETTSEELPLSSVPETTGSEEKEKEKEEKEKEKEEKEADKEQEKEEKEAEKEAEEEGSDTGPTGPPTEVPPPHSHGGDEGSSEEPSGGISPSNPVDEGD